MNRCPACRAAFPSMAAMYGHLFASAIRAPAGDREGRQTIQARSRKRKRAKRPAGTAPWVPLTPATLKAFEPLGKASEEER